MSLWVSIDTHDVDKELKTALERKRTIVNQKTETTQRERISTLRQ